MVTWIETYSGARFHPLAPRPAEVYLHDIAHALSLLCRFGGHCSKFYSVAQHSVGVSLLCSPENALWGLLHDASEAYLTDVPRPLKHSITMQAYRVAEHAVMDAICEYFKLPLEEPQEIKNADNTMLRREAYDLMPGRGHNYSCFAGVPLPAGRIVPASPRKAEALFLRRYVELTGIRPGLLRRRAILTETITC
jgi:hypothetical protein